MPNTFILDTGPLGLLAHDRSTVREPLQTWLDQEMSEGATIYLSEVADYELRREVTRLVQAGQLLPSRLARLNQLPEILTYLPATTSYWLESLRDSWDRHHCREVESCGWVTRGGGAPIGECVPLARLSQDL